jgi:hypothetical protein
VSSSDKWYETLVDGMLRGGEFFVKNSLGGYEKLELILIMRSLALASFLHSI